MCSWPHGFVGLLEIGPPSPILNPSATETVSENGPIDPGDVLLQHGPADILGN